MKVPGLIDRLLEDHPGLASLEIFSRPYGTCHPFGIVPSTSCWATLSRPCGTEFGPSASVRPGALAVTGLLSKRSGR